MEIGDIGGSDLPIETASGFTEAVIIVRGETGPLYTLDSGETLTDISGNANVVPARQVAYKDFRFFLVPYDGDPTIFSDVGDAGTYDVDAFIDAEQFPDKNVTAFVLNNILYIAGTDTIELFDATGDPNVPFLRKDGAGIDFGFIGALLEYGETFLFIGREKNQGPGIYAVGSGTAKRISNERVDLLLSQYTQGQLEEVVAGRIKWRNNDFATFTFPDKALGFIYGEWFELESLDDVGQSQPWEADHIVQFRNIYYSFSGNKINRFEAVNTDFGETVKRAIQFGVESAEHDFFAAQSMKVGISQGFNPYTVIETTNEGASYSGKFLDVTDQTSNVKCAKFGDSGNKLFVLGGTTLYQYELDNPYDLLADHVSYNGASFSFANEDTNPQGFAWNDDGTIILLCGQANGGDLYEYNLSTPFDLGNPADNVVYSGDSFVQTQGVENDIWDIKFNDDGSKFFASFIEGTSLIKEYDLTVPYSMAEGNVVDTGNSISVTGDSVFSFNNDGTQLFILFFNIDYEIDVYTLSTPYDLSTESFSSNETVSGSLSPSAMVWNATGQSYYLLDSITGDMYQYELTTNFDISTLDHIDQVTAGVPDLDSYDSFSFGNDGFLLIVEGTLDGVSTLYELNLQVPYSFEGNITYDGSSFNVNDAVGSGAFALTYNDDGSKLFTGNGVGNTVFEFDLYAPWILQNTDNIVYADDQFPIGSEDSQPTGVSYNGDGTKVYVTGVTNNQAYEYNLTTPYKIVEETDTVNANGNQFDTTSVDGFDDMGWDDVGDIFFLLTNDDEAVHSHSVGIAWDLSAITGVPTTILDLSDLDNNPDNNPWGMAWGDGGMAFFFSGEDNNAVIQLDILGTPYVLDDLVDNTKSFSLAGQMTEPRNIRFNQDGSSIFVADRTTPTIFQYSMAEPFLATDANVTYTGNSYDFTDEIDVIGGFSFSLDGLKLFVTNLASSSASFVFQYELVYPFSLADGNITYSGYSYHVGGGQEIVTISFNDGDTSPGSLMYLGAEQGLLFREYDLENNYDIGSGFDISYSGEYFEFADQMTNPQDLIFDSDGLKSFAVGKDNATAFQYTHLVAYEIGHTPSVVDSGKSFFTATGAYNTTGDFIFNNDGSNMYTLYPGEADNAEGFQFDLSTEYDLDTAVDSGNSIEFPDGIIEKWSFNDTGEIIYGLENGDTAYILRSFQLGTAYDFSSGITDLSETYTFSHNVNCIRFIPDGTKLFAYDLLGGDQLTYEYALTIPFYIDENNISLVTTFTSHEEVVQSIDFNADGSNMYLVDRNGIIHTYELENPYTLVGTVTETGESYTTANVTGRVVTGIFGNSGSNFYYYNSLDRKVFEYDLAAAYITNPVVDMEYSGNSYTFTEDTAPVSIDFDDFGDELYMAGSSSSTVYQYDLNERHSLEQYTTTELDRVAPSVSLRISRDNVNFGYSMTRDTGDLGDHSKQLIFNEPGGFGVVEGFMGFEIWTTQDIIFASKYLIIDAKGELKLA